MYLCRRACCVCDCCAPFPEKRVAKTAPTVSSFFLLVPTSNHFRRLLLLLLQLDLPTTLRILARLEVQTLLHIHQDRLAIKHLATRCGVHIPRIVPVADVSLARVCHLSHKVGMVKGTQRMKSVNVSLFDRFQLGPIPNLHFPQQLNVEMLRSQLTHQSIQLGRPVWILGLVFMLGQSV